MSDELFSAHAQGALLYPPYENGNAGPIFERNSCTAPIATWRVGTFDSLLDGWGDQIDMQRKGWGLALIMVTLYKKGMI